MDHMKENYPDKVRTGYLFSPTGNFESCDQGCTDQLENAEDYGGPLKEIFGCVMRAIREKLFFR